MSVSGSAASPSRVEQLERRPRMPLAAGGVEVAVDRELRVARRLEGALARGCREGLLATRDRGRLPSPQ